MEWGDLAEKKVILVGFTIRRPHIPFLFFFLKGFPDIFLGKTLTR
jgi:hypothetical protein